MSGNRMYTVCRAVAKHTRVGEGGCETQLCRQHSLFLLIVVDLIVTVAFIIPVEVETYFTSHFLDLNSQSMTRP